MTFLPVVDRELRVSARKESTYSLRVVSALVAMILAFGFIFVTEIASTPRGMGPSALGRGLFGALSWLGLAGVLCSGVFLTSDCLSEERREGTLGLLFLTDLRGYHVVLGKLFSTSLRAVYGLLAMVPILGMPLLLGGVTFGQFWMTALALFNALVVSLAAGMLVSSVARESQSAMAGTVALILLASGAGPVADVVVAAVRSSFWFRPFFSNASPVYLFWTGATSGGEAFWWGLLINQLVAWGMMGLACFLLPRSWRESGAVPETRSWNRPYRQRLRARLLETHPAAWLVLRQRGQTRTFWLLLSLMIVLTWAGLQFLGIAVGQMMLPAVGGAFNLMVYLGAAVRAGRVFVEGRRGGLLELLLVTPLGGDRIVRGYWRGIVRRFGLPVALFALAQGSMSLLTFHSIWGAVATPAATKPAAGVQAGTESNTVVVSITNGSAVTVGASGAAATASGGPGSGALWASGVVTSLAVTATVAGNLAALIWFGMWMGLTSKSVTASTAKTMVFVLVVPWFAVTAVSSMMIPLVLMPMLMSGGGAWGGAASFVWYSVLTAGLSAVLHLGKDMFFVLWSRRRLYSQFRDRVVQLASGPLL